MELALEEQLNSRALAADKHSARESLKDQAKDKAIDEVKKQAVRIAKQAVLRTINIAFAATVVGILITWVIMSVQIFVGNLLGVKTIALEGIEIGIYAALSFLILLVVIMVIMGAMFIVGPWLKIISFLQDALNSIIGN